MNKLNLENLKSFLEQKSENFDLDQDTNDFDEFISQFESEYDSLFKSNLYIERITDDAVLPSYAYPTDSGFDLYSTEEVVIPSLSRVLVSTGLKVSFSPNLELQIRPKSGLAHKLGLTVLNTPGTIDQGYTGEIKVILFNTSQESVTISKKMKIAQAVLTPVINGGNVEIVEVQSIDNKDRGDNGFGSTGIY
jgi:dUTP pyrophosphatase